MSAVRRLIKSQNMPSLLIGRIGKKTAIECRDAETARETMRMHIRAAGEDMDLPSLKTRKSK